MNRLPLRPVIPLAGLLLSLGLGAAGCSRSGSAEHRPQGESIYKAVKRPLQFTLHLNGDVQSSSQSLVRSEIGGTVSSIPVKEGDLVAKGAAVCEIVSRRKDSEFRRAEHQLEIARLELAKEEAKAATAENAAVAAVEQKIARQKLAIAQIDRDDLSADMDRLVIRAPFAGRVAAIEVKVGDLVTGSSGFMIGSAILQLVPDAEFAINTNVGEHEVVNINLGQKVEVIIPALNDQHFEGRVTRLAQVGIQATSRARVFPITVVFSGGSAPLRIGMSGNIRVPIVRSGEVLLLPITAVQSDAAGPYVMVKLPETRERRAVSLGIATAADVEIISGLSAGDDVVVPQ